MADVFARSRTESISKDPCEARGWQDSDGNMSPLVVESRVLKDLPV